MEIKEGQYYISKDYNFIEMKNPFIKVLKKNHGFYKRVLIRVFWLDQYYQEEISPSVLRDYYRELNKKENKIIKLLEIK